MRSQNLGILRLFATLNYIQIIEISPFQAFRRSVTTVMQVVPKELRYVTILTLLGGSSPAIAIWLNKVIIDEITRLLSIGTTQNAIALILSQPLLLSSIAGSLLVNLVSDAIASINNFVYTSLRVGVARRRHRSR
ncbi:MAG: hypothetical protein V7K88_02785 [Nostoc sp.]|uniref:hypothetical protein n=1 Tax=Nostoc sp. TaxID=1180 RepID=UPI002FFBF016